MPFLDVSDLLTDPDFVEMELTCQRQLQTIGTNGLAVNRSVAFPFVGVVTQVAPNDLNRNAVGELITGSILICTRFRLTDGLSGGTSADIVQWGSRTYTVANVNNYSRYGRGFVEATCQLLPLAGNNPPAPGQPPGF